MSGLCLPVALRLQAPTRLAKARPFRYQQLLNSRVLLYHAVRTYATPGRPKKGSVGEPSTRVKSAVKRAARVATSSDTPAVKKVAAKKQKAPTKKKAPVKKPKKVAKKAVKKVAKKTPVKKEKTPEQKAAKAAADERVKKRELVRVALKPPFKVEVTPWLEYIRANKSGYPDKGQDAAGIRKTFTEQIKRLSAGFRQLTPADREHYNHLAHVATEANAAEFQRWLQGQTPQQIYAANQARRTLNRKWPSAKKSGKAPFPLIPDERAIQSKTLASSYALFTRSRWSSGDFKNFGAAEALPLIAKEWKALGDSERKKYHDLSAQGRQRYIEEYTSTYGHAPPFLATTPRPVRKSRTPPVAQQQQQAAPQAAAAAA